jgi:autotransporter translocation and assembly factor TamB
MRSLWRLGRALLWAAGGTAALLAVAAVLVGALSLGWQRARLRDALERWLGERLGAAARIERLEGTLHRDPRARGVQLTDSRGNRLRLERVQLRLDPVQSLRERRLVIKTLDLRGLRLRMQVDADDVDREGRAGPAGRDRGPTDGLPLRIETLSLEAEQIELVDERGSVRGAVELHAADLRPRSGAPWPWPREGRALLEVEQARIGEVDVAHAAAQLEIDGRIVRVRELRARTDRGSVTLGGHVDPGFGPPARAAGLALDGEIRALELDRWLGAPPLGAAVTGPVALRASVPPGGTLREAEGILTLDLSSSAEPGDGREVGVGGREAGARLRLAARYAGGDWRVDSLSLRSELLALQLEGRGSLTGIEHAAVRLSADDLKPLSRAFGSGHALEGAAQLEARVWGPWNALAAELERLQLSSPGLEVSLAAPATLHLVQETLTIDDLRLVSGRQRLALSGGAGPHGFAVLAVRGRNLDVAWLAARLGADLPIGGTLGLDVVLDGPLTAPVPRGSVLWRDVQIRDATADALRVALAARDQLLQAQLTLEARGRVIARADARVPLPVGAEPWSWPALVRDPRTAFQARAKQLEVSLLAPLLPPWLRDPAGRAQLQLEVSGGPAGLSLQGQAQLEAARVRVPALQQTLAPIEAQLRFTRREIEVRRIQVGPDDAAARLRGRLTLDDRAAAALDLQAMLRGFRIAEFPLDGTARISGAMTAPVVRADLRIRPGRYALPEPEDPIWTEIRILELESDDTSSGGSAGAGVLSASDLRASIRVPPKVWIVGRGAELEVEAQLHVDQDPGQAPVYTGELEVVRGLYRLLGRSFDVARGRAWLSGESSLDPALDIAARTRIRDARVTALIGGRLSEPRVQLRSDPPLPESDILSLLAFGRPSDELDQGQAASLESALSEVGGQLVLNQLRGLLGSRLPVDTAELRLDEEGDGARLGVGRYLGDEVFVRYGRVFGSDAQDEVSVEWRLTPRISLESQITSGGAAGADLLFRRDY